MAECTVEPDSIPELPMVVLTKMASMLRMRGNEGWIFGNRLQLAAVSRQLRQAVLSSIQQIERRRMWIRIEKDHISVSGINVKNERRSPYSVTRRLLSGTQQIIRRMMSTRVNHESNKGLRSAYTQMDCVDALLAFVQPNLLHLDLSRSRDLILMRSLPLSVTSLFLELRVKEIGVDSPLDKILKAIGSKTNLETLKIVVYCYNDSAAATHMRNSPSVPKNSPFNHLLTLRNLRALCIDAEGLLSPAQMVDLLNRSQSKITHICCEASEGYEPQERDELFKAMSDVVRGNITSISCVRLRSVQADQSQFLDCLPNCATIHFVLWFKNVSRQKLNELGESLLDVCCGNDVHPGRTLECGVECYNDSVLQNCVEDGGELQMEYAHKKTVVRLSIESFEMMRHKHCPFGNNLLDFL